MTDLVDAPSGADAERVVIRFAGDSGDGMQLTGDRFTSASALFGNDLATLPEFPAEIRAPAGTLAGVSAFQVQISSADVSTPGDEPTVLVAMNPAALKSDLDRLAVGGTLIVNEDAFEERNLEKAGYVDNPLEDGSLDGYALITIPMDGSKPSAMVATPFGRSCAGSVASPWPSMRRTPISVGSSPRRPTAPLESFLPF